MSSMSNKKPCALINPSNSLLTYDTELCIVDCSKTASKDKLIISSRDTIKIKSFCSLCNGHNKKWIAGCIN